MFSPCGAERICKNMLYSIVGIDYHKIRTVSTKTFENTLLSAGCKKSRGKLWQKERGSDGTSPLDKLLLLKRRCCGRTGERTPLVPPQACAGWAEPVNSHALPRILLPQNRCLPHLLAAPFPHQLEPRCNTLDFASKVVCQRAFRRSLESSRKLDSQAKKHPQALVWQKRLRVSVRRSRVNEVDRSLSDLMKAEYGC